MYIFLFSRVTFIRFFFIQAYIKPSLGKLWCDGVMFNAFYDVDNFLFIYFNIVSLN